MQKLLGLLINEMIAERLQMGKDAITAVDRIMLEIAVGEIETLTEIDSEFWIF